jgi:hypothetical protein
MAGQFIRRVGRRICSSFGGFALGAGRPAAWQRRPSAAIAGHSAVLASTHLAEQSRWPGHRDPGGGGAQGGFSEFAACSSGRAANTAASVAALVPACGTARLR